MFDLIRSLPADWWPIYIILAELLLLPIAWMIQKVMVWKWEPIPVPGGRRYFRVPKRDERLIGELKGAFDRLTATDNETVRARIERELLEDELFSKWRDQNRYHFVEMVCLIPNSAGACALLDVGCAKEALAADPRNRLQYTAEISGIEGTMARALTAYRVGRTPPAGEARCRVVSPCGTVVQEIDRQLIGVERWLVRVARVASVFGLRRLFDSVILHELVHCAQHLREGALAREFFGPHSRRWWLRIEWQACWKAPLATTAFFVIGGIHCFIASETVSLLLP